MSDKKRYRLARPLLLLCLLLGCFVWGGDLCAQQVRRVYITLDVSYSMAGNKYVLANYTTQMIATLCDDDDEVYLIIGGNPIPLQHGANSLQTIQKQYSDHRHISAMESQFGDIVGFNSIYAPSSKKQDWLFIIGDGVWETQSNMYKADREKFARLVGSGRLNVCFLRTYEKKSEHCDFRDFVQPMGIVDIKEASTSVSSIRSGCDFFARKILGFSDVPLKVKSSQRNTITVTSELPLSQFIVVYQQDVDQQSLPTLQTAKTATQDLSVRLKGTPTTTPVRTPKDQCLSGSVWRVEATNGYIPAKQTVELVFDKKVDTKNITIFPLIKEVEFSTAGLTPSGNTLKRIDANVLSICKDEKSAVVRVNVGETTRQLIPDELLRKTKVSVKANNRSYEAKYNNGAFEAEIDLVDNETQYYAEIDCPGYFKRVTSITTVKKESCEKAQPVVKQNQVSDFGTMTFEQLKNGEIRGRFHDLESLEVLDPTKFDVSVEIEDGMLYDDPVVRVEGDELVIEAHPIGDWCECLFPKELNIKVVSRPTEGAFADEGKRYDVLEQPIHLTIEKTRAWVPRCMWAILTLVALLLVAIYLHLLLKKRRFKKSARILSTYYDYYGRPVSNSARYLRKSGFGAWLSRWFSPIDERITLAWNQPSVRAFTVVASETKDAICIPRKSFSPSTMTFSGYDDDDFEDKKMKELKWNDNEAIGVAKQGGGKGGELVFSADDEDDGVAFRLLVGILMVLCIVSFLVLAVLMIRSLI